MHFLAGSRYESFTTSETTSVGVKSDIVPDIPREQNERLPLIEKPNITSDMSFKQRQLTAFSNLLEALFPVRRKFIHSGILSKIFFIIKVRIYVYSIIITILVYSVPKILLTAFIIDVHNYLSILVAY